MTRRLIPSRRSKRQQVKPDHGDWRVHLENPEEVAHMKMEPVHNLFDRTRLKVKYLSSLAATYDYAYEDDETWTPLQGARRWVRLLLALFVLLPLSVVMVFALLVQLYHAAPTMSTANFWLSEPVWFTLVGGAFFASLRFSTVADKLLVYAYVLGHELTHAIAAILSFGKVQSVHVDMSGGYVETDADNLFIALSPYFVPLWMLCWLGALFCVNYFWPFEEYQPWFYAGIGFWWVFHLYWTAWIIPREQPDLLENGLLFSMLVVMLMNIGILLLGLMGFGVVSFSGYVDDFVTCAQSLGETAVYALHRLSYFLHALFDVISAM